MQLNQNLVIFPYTITYFVSSLSKGNPGAYLVTVVRYSMPRYHVRTRHSTVQYWISHKGTMYIFGKKYIS